MAHRTFTFGDHDLSKLLLVKSVEKNFANFENQFYNVGRADGQKLRTQRIKENTLTITCTLLDQISGKSVQETKDELIQILKPRGLQRLIISDQPDRYYDAALDGTINYDATVDEIAEVELTFAVPDGVAYSIDEDYFTNVDVSIDNLFLDSEFENKDHYFKPYCFKGPKDGGNNTLVADFTNYITLYGKENWLVNTNETTRPMPGIKKGDSYSFGMSVRIDKLATDGTVQALSTVILEERDKVGGNILMRHVIDAATTAGTWQNLSKTIQIQSDKTKALNLTVCVRGNARLTIKKPQFNEGTSLKPYVASKKTISDKIEVNHRGTWKAYPKFEITMQGENGLIGLVNSNGGVLQYGDPEDADTVRVWGRNRVLNDSWDAQTLTSNAVLNDVSYKSTYPNLNGNAATPNVKAGNVKSNNASAFLPVYTGSNNKGWNGPAITVPIPANANNTQDGDFTAWQRIEFTDHNQARQKGRFEMTLTDDQKNVFMAVVVRDSTNVSSELIVEFWYKNQLVKQGNLPKKQWTGSFLEVKMERLNFQSKLHWRFSQIRSLNPQTGGANTNRDFDFYMNFNNPSEKTKVQALTGWMMRLQNANAQNTTFMSWTDTKFFWTEVTLADNRSNILDDGDFFEIDTRSRKIFINGVENKTLHKLGNEYDKFILDYGPHTIQIVPSSWALTPIVGIKIQRVYL